MEIEATTLLLAIAAAIVILFLTVAVLRRHKDSTLYAPKRLMTDHELAFYEKLDQAVESFGRYGVMSQVSMSAFIQPQAGLSKSDRQRAWNSIAQKTVDFVIIDAVGTVLAVIELDDKTHSADKDRNRDALVSKAGFKTIRFRNGFKLTPRQITEKLKPIL